MMHVGFIICFIVAAGFTAKLGDLALLVSLSVTTAILRRFFLCIVFSVVAYRPGGLRAW